MRSAVGQIRWCKLGFNVGLWPRESSHRDAKRAAGLLRIPAGRVSCGMMTAVDPKRTLILLRVILLLSVVVSLNTIAVEDRLTKELDDFFSVMAEEMNKGLPEMVDEVSRLERVSYSDLTFTHHYTAVGIGDDEFGRDFPDEVLKGFFSHNACGHQQSRNAMQDGLTFAYEFTSEGGTALATVEITYADCEDS